MINAGAPVGLTVPGPLLVIVKRQIMGVGSTMFYKKEWPT